MTKLSFIVPVYNVAPYLRKCVDSLLAQDYKDYEIILVDDGSTDGCADICEEYKKRLPSLQGRVGVRPIIQVIHQENAGVGAARNTGIEVAKGEYICFVDSDDYWEPNVLGSLMAQIERDKLDVLRFKYQNVNDQYEIFNPNKSNPYRNDDYSEGPTDGITFLNTRFGTACYAVMFILRRDLILGDKASFHHSINPSLPTVLFTEGIYFEDTDWTPRMLVRARRVASTDTIVYDYLIHQGSITNAQSRIKKKKVLDDKMRLIGALQQQAEELRKKGQLSQWYNKMIAANTISIIHKISSEFYNEREYYLEKLKQQEIFPIESVSLKAFIINISPRIAVELLHRKNG